MKNENKKQRYKEIFYILSINTLVQQQKKTITKNTALAAPVPANKNKKMETKEPNAAKNTRHHRVYNFRLYKFIAPDVLLNVYIIFHSLLYIDYLSVLFLFLLLLLLLSFSFHSDSCIFRSANILLFFHLSYFKMNGNF